MKCPFGASQTSNNEVCASPDSLATGMTAREVMGEYGLEEADIPACIAYGAETAREHYVEIPADGR